MDKYHITKKGDLAPCRAKIRACPVGGEHFESVLEAEKYFKKLAEGEVNFDVREKQLSDVRKYFSDFRENERLDAVEKRSLKNVATLVAIPIVGTAIMGGAMMGQEIYHEHNGATSFSHTVGAVKGYNQIPKNSQDYHGSVMGANLKESQFNGCVNGAQKDYVTCKTTDGKYTITAHVNHRKPKGTNYNILERIQVKENASGKNFNLKHTVESSNKNGVNYYIPKSSTN